MNGSKQNVEDQEYWYQKSIDKPVTQKTEPVDT